MVFFSPLLWSEVFLNRLTHIHTHTPHTFIYNLYEDVDISFIMLSRLRWRGHVNTMDKERKVNKMFYNLPQAT